MLNLDDIANELLETVLRNLERAPDLAARLRAVLGTDRPPEPDLAKLLTVSEYAEHTGYCSRTIENLIKEGMPLVGKGRRRRVCVGEADEWLRERHVERKGQVPGPMSDIAERARQDARRSLEREQRRALRKAQRSER